MGGWGVEGGRAGGWRAEGGRAQGGRASLGAGSGSSFTPDYQTSMRAHCHKRLPTSACPHFRSAQLGRIVDGAKAVADQKKTLSDADLEALIGDKLNVTTTVRHEPIRTDVPSAPRHH